MDRTRVVALALIGAGAVGIVLALASVGYQFDPLRSWGWLGAAIGLSMRGWYDHRERGVGAGLRWMGAWFALTATIALACQAAGAALAPVLADKGIPTLPLIAAAFLVLAAGAVLWERDRRVKLAIALSSASLVLLVGGSLGVMAAGFEVIDAAWTVPALVSLTSGVVLVVVSMRYSLILLRSHEAERAATRRVGADPVMDAVA
jgi:hypothetical protein